MGIAKAVVGVLGAVAGAVVGNAIERTGTREEAVEILLQLRNGERRAIVQAKGHETLNPGDAVIIVTTGGKTRVTRAPGVAPSGNAPVARRCRRRVEREAGAMRPANPGGPSWT